MNAKVPTLCELGKKLHYLKSKPEVTTLAFKMGYHDLCLVC